MILIACKQNKDFDFNGKWQSLNERAYVVEITSDKRYNTYRDGKLLPELSNIEIDISHNRGNWYEFSIWEDKIKKIKFISGRIESISDDRIRIYFHKHHDILDLADEFHRTNDLLSFDEIMNKILESPE